MTKIRLAQELVSEKTPLFITLLEELDIVEASDQTPTMGTDGKKIIYNKQFVETLTAEETAAVLLHETLHCTFNHLWRKGKRNHQKFNVAADFAINGIVNENFKLPQGGLLDSKYFGMSAEDIYDKLPSSVKQQKWGDHSLWEGQPKQAKPQKGIVAKIADKLKKMGQPQKTDINNQGKELTRQKWENIFKERILKNYGKLPDSIKRIIEKHYYIPVIDWSTLLANILSEDINDYDFCHPDRRFLESDIVMPGLYSVDKIKDVIFGYDTSGSISSEDLTAFYIESLNLFNNFASLDGWVAICDASLHSFKEISSRDTMEDFGFTGGGGTSFEPVFNEIERRGLSPRAVFYFTDTQGDFPRQAPSYPVYWLVKSYIGDNSVPWVPFGTVIKFMPKI